MSKILLAAGVAAMALTAGSSLAAARHHKSASPVVSGPPQPIPYAQLDAYLKASPKQRASRDWSGGSTSASTGATADTSAAARTSPSAGAATSPDTSASPPAAESSPDTSSPPATATPDQGKGDPSATPPATKTPPDAASPN